jgi:hypothetical protein
MFNQYHETRDVSPEGPPAPGLGLHVVGQRIRASLLPVVITAGQRSPTVCGRGTFFALHFFFV